MGCLLYTEASISRAASKTSVAGYATGNAEAQLNRTTVSIPSNQTIRRTFAVAQRFDVFSPGTLIHVGLLDTQGDAQTQDEDSCRSN